MKDEGRIGARKFSGALVPRTIKTKGWQGMQESKVCPSPAHHPAYLAETDDSPDSNDAALLRGGEEAPTHAIRMGDLPLAIHASKRLKRPAGMRAVRFDSDGMRRRCAIAGRLQSYPTPSTYATPPCIMTLQARNVKHRWEEESQRCFRLTHHVSVKSCSHRCLLRHGSHYAATKSTRP